MGMDDPRFLAWMMAHPTYWPAIQREAHRLLRAGHDRLSMKHIFENLRGRLQYLDNTFTAPMARYAMRHDPQLAGRFETRSFR